MNKGSVAPVKLYIRNDEWAVDVRRTVAYRASCDCEWRGPSRRSYAEARADLRAHRATH